MIAKFRVGWDRIRSGYRIAKGLGRQYQRPVFPIFLDMLSEGIRHRVAFHDYLEWDFLLLEPSERRSFCTSPQSWKYTDTLNSNQQANLDLANKIRFNSRFDSFLGREWIDLTEADAKTLGDFVSRHDEVIAKVPTNLGGVGVEKLTGLGERDLAQLRDALLAKGQVLLEEVLTQHPELRQLNPSSVNSLRIITYLSGDHVEILATVLRIGTGKAVDNFAAGGMYVLLDDDGVAIHPGFDKENRVHETHPITGVRIPGFTVPHFPEVIETAKQIARLIPEVPLVGWDLAVTENGVAVIEGNYNTGLFQPKPSVSGVRSGYRERYRKAIGF